MANKCQDEDNVTLIDDPPSHGISSSTSDDKASIKTQRKSEISAISSQRVQSELQTSVRSDPKSCQSSKESGELVQLSSGDSVDPKLCQSPNENSASGCSDVGEKGGKNGCNFDLNEGTQPITVVAKVGVPIGQPKTPLQFDGELGWRSSMTTSAFRPTFPSKNGASCGSPRQSLASQGIDLNVAFTMDSEQTQRFDLNDNPCKNMSQIGENSPQEMPRPSSSYWVDLSSSLKGFNHTRSRPFLLTVPTSEQQLQMMVPIPIPNQSEISFMPSTFYLNNNSNNNNNNNQHPVGPMIPHHLGAYTGGIHVIDSSPPQLLYATPVRPTFGQNMEFFAKKRREPEGGLDYSQVSQVSCRPMASWK